MRSFAQAELLRQQVMAERDRAVLAEAALQAEREQAEAALRAERERAEAALRAERQRAAEVAALRAQLAAMQFERPATG